MKNKKAEMGMGTLIIFIAMILVAAVAAGVLISTTGSLQNKALATGKATTQEVGTSMSAIELSAEDASDQQLDFFYMTIKLAAGSEPIRFEDTLLSMNLNDQSADYEYNSSISCSTEAHMSAGENFGVSYQIQGSSYNSGYLNKGDVVKLCFRAPRAVNESEDLKLTLVPMIGSALSVDTTTPDLMVDSRIAIYP